MKYREWHQRVFFAEFAEAVGIPTTDVLDVLIRPRLGAQDEVIVVYTIGPHDVERAEVWEAALERDEHGVLVVSGKRERPTGIEELKKRLEEQQNGPETGDGDV